MEFKDVITDPAQFRELRAPATMRREDHRNHGTGTANAAERLPVRHLRR